MCDLSDVSRREVRVVCSGRRVVCLSVKKAGFMERW